MKGFFEIDPFLISHPDAVGIDRQYAPTAKACLAFGTVAELTTQRLGNLGCPAFVIDDLEVTGQMSGSPVFDEQGRVVGIVSSALEDGGRTTAIDWTALIAGSRQRHGTVPIVLPGDVILPTED